ncbi:MAG TPA: hypothetical protein DCP90_03140 [Clostridiales bacterium]|nr:MAG: hypothetical protein A2Y22_08110 [Clostridiales bacterium GWD2_32_59]HAN09590.1 hypothetical protein [Clostridiales bacterium]
MKFRIEYLLFATAICVGILTGCDGNTTAVNPPGTPDYEMSERITTRTPTTNGIMGGTTRNNNDLGTDLNTLTNDGFGTATDGLFGENPDNGYGNNNNGTTGTTAGPTTGTTTDGTTGTTTAQANDINSLQTLANQCETRLDNVAGVQDSEVVLIGNEAYVACKLNNNATTVPESVKNSILDTVKSVNPNITRCYVLTQDTQFNQIKAFGDNLNNLGNITTNAAPVTSGY